MSLADLEPATATSIGRLPHADPVAATALVLDAHPGLPAAPELPAMRVPLGDVAFDSSHWEGLNTFLAAVADRTAPVKIQLTGPFTRAVALRRKGMSLPEAMDVAGAGVRRQAAALVAHVRARVPAAPLVAFLDERALTSLTSPGFDVDPDALVDLLSGALAALSGADPGLVTGVHCCGPTDWQLITAAGPDIASLPLEAVGGSGSALALHLERGGWVAWGAVPTGRPLGTNPDPLWRRLVETWCELTGDGADPVRLRRQALITPACGLGGHGLSQAERVLRLTTEIAERVHDQAVAARLSVGA